MLPDRNSLRFEVAKCKCVLEFENDEIFLMVVVKFGSPH
jgi:hypothetical protein